MSRMVIALSVISLVLFAGCSKAPDLELQAAQAALDAARTAEAEEYAPEAFSSALDTLNAAMAAKQEQDSKFKLWRSYGASKEKLVQARLLAEKAVSQAAAGKEELVQEVTDLLEQAQAALDGANTALAGAPVGKGSRAEIELMKNDLASAAAALTEARGDFDSGMYKSAKARAEAVIDKATAVSNDIAAAIAKKAGK